MKIELKSIKVVASMSEETTCFSADVFINGKKTLYASNRGQGGCTDYHLHDFKDKEILRQVEEYCSSLPDIYVEKYDFTHKQTLESVIDDLLNEHLDKLEDKKLETKCKKGICYGTKERYQMIYWNGTSLEALLKTPAGKLRVTQILKDLRAKGENILNTNLTEF